MEDKNKLSKEVKTKNMDTKPETNLETKDFQVPGKVSGTIPINIDKPVLVYDLALLPEDMDIKAVLDKYEEEGILVYDSTRTMHNSRLKTPYTINL